MIAAAVEAVVVVIVAAVDAEHPVAADVAATAVDVAEAVEVALLVERR